MIFYCKETAMGIKVNAQQREDSAYLTSVQKYVNLKYKLMSFKK